MASTNKTSRLGLSNWTGDDYPERTDFTSDNTIIDSRMIRRTTSDISYFVNGATGNDSTGNGTEAYPFKTMAKLMSVMPEYLAHSITVNVANALNSEVVSISGRVGPGALRLNMNGNTVTSLAVSYCTCPVAIYDCKAYLPGDTGAAFSAVGSSRVYMDSCTVLSRSSSSSSGRGFTSSWNSFLYVYYPELPSTIFAGDGISFLATLGGRLYIFHWDAPSVASYKVQASTGAIVHIGDGILPGLIKSASFGGAILGPGSVILP